MSTIFIRHLVPLSYSTTVLQKNVLSFKARMHYLYTQIKCKEMARNILLQSYPAIKIQARNYSNIEVPDYTKYRRRSVKSPKVKSNDSVDSRRLHPYFVVAAAGIAGAYATKAVTLQYIYFMGASKDVLALAQMEIKLSDVPEGKSVTYKWRGKPLFVWHRTADDVDRARAVDIATLRDPERDEDRTQRAEWLVVLGICTHLGCVPIAGQGDFGGYYCPCHGSHFDGSGRARKGPAPTNLEVPEYRFAENDVLVVG